MTFGRKALWPWQLVVPGLLRLWLPRYSSAPGCASFTSLSIPSFSFPHRTSGCFSLMPNYQSGRLPFSRNTFRYASWFTLYFRPGAVFPFGRQLSSSNRSFTHAKYSSTSGLIEDFFSFSLSSPDSNWSLRDGLLWSWDLTGWGPASGSPAWKTK